MGLRKSQDKYLLIKLCLCLIAIVANIMLIATNTDVLNWVASLMLFVIDRPSLVISIVLIIVLLILNFKDHISE